MNIKKLIKKPNWATNEEYRKFLERVIEGEAKEVIKQPEWATDEEYQRILENRVIKIYKPGGIPDWAWYITWGIMLAGIVLNVIGIVGLLVR